MVHLPQSHTRVERSLSEPTKSSNIEAKTGLFKSNPAETAHVFGLINTVQHRTKNDARFRSISSGSLKPSVTETLRYYLLLRKDSSKK